MTIPINQLTSGLVLRVEGELYLVVEYHHVKPAKGSAFVRVKLKNLKTDLTIERTFRSADKLDDVFLEERTLQYSYQTGDTYHFIDQETFEDVAILKEQLGDVIKYFQDNLNVTAIICDHKVQKILLPNFIIAKVTTTEPGFRGDTSKAGTKPATIDTGAVVPVPLFINVGDCIKVDTRNGQYVERVQR